MLQKRIDKLDAKQNEVEATHKIQLEKLETISGISAENAKQEILESLKKKERAIVFAERHGNKQSKTIKTSIWIDMYADLVKLQGLEEQLKLAIQKRNQEHEKIK